MNVFEINLRMVVCSEEKRNVVFIVILPVLPSKAKYKLCYEPE